MWTLLKQVGTAELWEFCVCFPLEALSPGRDAICCGYEARSKEVSREVKLKQETRDSEESCTNWGTSVGRQREAYTGRILIYRQLTCCEILGQWQRDVEGRGARPNLLFG